MSKKRVVIITDSVTGKACKFDAISQVDIMEHIFEMIEFGCAVEGEVAAISIIMEDEDEDD